MTGLEKDGKCTKQIGQGKESKRDDPETSGEEMEQNGGERERIR